MNYHLLYLIGITLFIQLMINVKNVHALPISDWEKGYKTRVKDDIWNYNRELDLRQMDDWKTKIDENVDNNYFDKNNLIDRCKMENSNPLLTENSAKRNVFLSRSWGAGGMPFNVLYMKHPIKNKSVRSSSIVAEPLRSQQEDEQPTVSGHNEPTSIRSETVFQNQEPANNDQVKIRSGNVSFGPRRQYSIIPQLFVSYGWGPIGKRNK